MTTRTRINLFASAVIAAGGFMLLGARPAAAATVIETCDKMLAVMRKQALACSAEGGTYYAYTSCDDNGYTVMGNCAP